MSIKDREDKKTHDKPGGYAYRKKINDKHSLVFFFIGMSVNLNLDTSLLTQKVFNVENFANITLFLYFGVVIMVTLLYLFLINPEFSHLVGAVWALVASRICHLILSIFAQGKPGRNWYLLFYTINGLIRGVISVSSIFYLLFEFLGSYVISQYFLNQSTHHYLNGTVFFSIVVSILQIICDVIIGSETSRQARKSLMISQAMYLMETLIGTVWITIVFFYYGMNKQNGSGSSGSSNGNGTENGKKKHEIAARKFKLIKYYRSKFSVVVVASLFRVVYHPVLVPYMMDIEYVYKLIASITFTVFQFFGRLSTFSIDEYIDAGKKPKDTSDAIFLIKQDIHLYLLFVYQTIICGLAAYSSWYQKYGFSNSALFVTFVTLSSGFISGYTDARGYEGSQAVLKYHAKLNKANGSAGAAGGGSGSTNDDKVTEKDAGDTSTVNDILPLMDYAAYLIGCIISYTAQNIITKYKMSLEFLILSNKKYLDRDTVDTLYSKLNF